MGPSPLLSRLLRQTMKGARGEIVQGSGTPLQGLLHPHPSPAPAVTDRYLWEIKRTMGEGIGKGLETGALAQDLLLFSGFQGEGGHSSEWDLKLVSKSLSKGSFQPALSTVSPTARCRPPLTPPCRMGRSTGPPLPGQEHQAQEALRAPGDFVAHDLPTWEGRMPMGAM